MKTKGRKILALFVCMVCLPSGCGNAQNEENLQFEGTDISSSNETAEQKKEEYLQSEMKGRITVSSFMEQEFLTAAAEQFMDIYPYVKVTVNVYNETSEAGSVEDYQTYLNTKIMKFLL